MPVPPWRIISVLERAESGALIRERDFERKVLIPNIRRVVKEYDIKYNPENVVPEDDSLARDVWEAGVDLFLSVGTFCTTTNRQMLFTEEELEEALWNFHDELVIGEGQDTKICGDSSHS
jgi:hypothetical protein